MARRYRNIGAWQRAHELALQVQGVTKSFPGNELYSLTSQLRRAAYSVPTNIVEGTARESLKDYLRFLSISRASLAETEYLLLLSHDLKYFDDPSYDHLTEQVNRTFAALHGLIKAIRAESSDQRT